MAMLAIETAGLEKRYPAQGGQEIHAVRGVNLTVQRGEIYALLGPNGAGKTTTIAMLTTLLTPSAGQAQVAGFDVVSQAAEVRRRIGVTFQEVVLDQDLTGRQVLDFHGQLYGQSRRRRQEQIAALADLVELREALDRPAGQYSGGMKRRLELARGLMTEPTILFLDEPTQGLDPQNRLGIWAYIRRLRAEQGLTLLLTTHYMEEAEALADRVGIIDHGQLIVQGTPTELVRQLGADLILMRGHGEASAFAERLGTASFVTGVSQHNTTNEVAEVEQRLQIGVDVGERRLVELIGLAQATGFQIAEVSVAKPSLADVFLQYTGRALRDQ
jgi:ABC-2 type transport system ATP-binding protein